MVLQLTSALDLREALAAEENEMVVGKVNVCYSGQGTALS